MMYYCSWCNMKFEEPVSYMEDMGEHFGRPVSMRVYGCPSCGGNYEEIGEEEECSY